MIGFAFLVSWIHDYEIAVLNPYHPCVRWLQTAHFQFAGNAAHLSLDYGSAVL